MNGHIVAIPLKTASGNDRFYMRAFREVSDLEKVHYEFSTEIETEDNLIFYCRGLWVAYKESQKPPNFEMKKFYEHLIAGGARHELFWWANHLSTFTHAPSIPPWDVENDSYWYSYHASSGGRMYVHVFSISPSLHTTRVVVQSNNRELVMCRTWVKTTATEVLYNICIGSTRRKVLAILNMLPD